MSVSFSITGLAAALNMSEADVRTAVGSGAIAAPDSVWMRQPVWSLDAFGQECIKHLLGGVMTIPEADRVVNLQRACVVLKALLRAERAEGWHDAT